MTGKKLSKIMVGTIAFADSLLSYFRTAEWIDKHLPDLVKPVLNPGVAVALWVAAIFFIFKPESMEKKDTGPAKGHGPNINAQGDVKIDKLIYTTSSGNAIDVSSQTSHPIAEQVKQKSGPHLVPKYTANKWFQFPGEGLEFPGIAAAFRNDVTSPNDEAQNITTHLTYIQRKSGHKIEINEALWIERNQNSMDIFTGKTSHLALAIQVPDSRPPNFLAVDIAYDPRLGDWVTTNIHSLAHGHYDLLIEIKADDYRAYFKSEGELSDRRNVWSTPIEIDEAHMRAHA